MTSDPDMTDHAGMTLPDLFTEVPEAARADAYERIGPRSRSWIKSTLALVESVYGHLPASSAHHRAWPERGLALECTHNRADWALCLVAPPFASAPRLAAALMCARLAGVPVLALFTHPGHCPPALLAGCELAGIEQVCVRKTDASCETLLRYLDETWGPAGRVLCFGDAGTHALELAIRNMPQCEVWTDHAPRIHIDPASGIDASVIAWAHPDARQEAGFCDVAYMSDDSRSVQARLRLGPGFEGCWLHADLSPEFFQVRQLSLATCESDR